MSGLYRELTQSQRAQQRQQRENRIAARQMAAEANAAAVVVTSSQASFPLLPGTDEILSFVPNAYFTGITSSGNATVYITPGDGL